MTNMIMIIIIIIIIMITVTIDRHRIINMSHKLRYRTHELYYDRCITTDRVVRSNRPNVVMPERTLKEACLVV